MPEPTDHQKPASYIAIQFADVGSTVFSIDMNGVTPLQLLAIAAYLELRGKNTLVQMENQRAQEEAEKAIARPKLVLPGQG